MVSLSSLCANQIETLTPPTPPPGNPQALTTFRARGAGDLTGKAFPGWGICSLSKRGGEN